jgi:peptidyl-prolyl cis-trans isomerase A (cyclophilin A)
MRSSLCLAAVLAFFGTAAFADEPTVAPVGTPPPAPLGPTVIVETSLGTITLALDPVHAPATVANFERYVLGKHFDGTMFYRVEPGFVIQAGSYDAAGNYRGGVRAPIPLEANNGLKNERGAVAMARGDDPASADAEFFIDLADNANLDQAPGDTANKTGYAVFAHVVSGMDVADKIAGVATGGKGPFPANVTPAEPVTIEKVTIAGASN